MTPEILSISAMFMIGLLGSGHCVGMCGGIVTALGFSAPVKSGRQQAGRRAQSRWLLLLSYHAGRITSYGVAGAIVGSLGQFGADYLSLGPALRAFAAIMLILMGCYLADWWRILVRLEGLGSHIWRYLQPIANGLFQVGNPFKGFLYGLVWGWLPCGLVYSALAYAAASVSPAGGFAAMIAFGAGTLPTLLLGGVFSQQLKSLLQQRSLRWFMGLVLILMGGWMLWSALLADHSHHHSHHSESTMQMPHSDSPAEHESHDSHMHDSHMHDSHTHH